MPFPGYPLGTTRTNATPTTDNHPADHNSLAAAANDLQAQLDAGLLEIAANSAEIANLSAAVTALTSRLSSVRYRSTRAAATYAVGDVLLSGTATVVDNVGGFTGNGGSSPLVLPFTGIWAIIVRFTDSTGFPSNVACRVDLGGINGSSHQFQAGTMLAQEFKVIRYCTASTTTSAMLRNGTGASLTGITGGFDAYLISGVRP